MTPITIQQCKQLYGNPDGAEMLCDVTTNERGTTFKTVEYLFIYGDKKIAVISKKENDQ